MPARLSVRDLDAHVLRPFIKKLLSRPKQRRAPLPFQVHPLERRVLLSLSPTIAGIQATDEGSPYELRLTATGTDAANITAWEIDWGDGTGPRLYDPAPAGGTVTNRYDAALTWTYPDGPATQAITARARVGATTWYDAGALSLDASFGVGPLKRGTIIHDVGSSSEKAYAIAALPDGRFVTAGTCYSAQDFCVVRYNADGSVDQSFGGGDGVASVNFSWYQYFGGMALWGDKIVVVGRADVGAGNTDGQYAIARFNADGTPDQTFGSGGKVTAGLGSGVDYAKSVAIHGNTMVAAGYSIVSGQLVFSAIRLNDQGQLDATFGSSGTVYYSFGTNTDALAEAVVVQNDGKVILGGRRTLKQATSPYGPINTDFALVRFTATGALDSTFGSSGMVRTDFQANPPDSCSSCQAGPYDSAYSLILEPDGQIVAVGESNNDFALARYNANGTLDTTFGIGGKQTTNFSGGVDRAYGVTLQGDKIVVVGEASSAAPYSTSYDFGVARYLANGTLDTTFATGGKTMTNLLPSGTSDSARGVVIYNGAILVAGNTGSNIGLARYLSDNRLTVNNVAPALGIGVEGAIEHGIETTLYLSRSDPGRDDFTWTIDWGDGTTQQTGSSTALLTHTYQLADGQASAAFTIRAWGSDEDGAWSQVQQPVVVYRQLPAPPVNLGSTMNPAGDAVLSWEPGNGVTGTSYRLYRAVNGGAFAFYRNVTGTSTTDAASNLQPGTLYAYYVTASKDGFESTPSNVTVVQTEPDVDDTAPTQAPTLSNGGVTASRITLNWTAVAGADAYDLYRDDQLFRTGLTGLTFDDIWINGGQQHRYRVRATNAYGTGPQSNEVTARAVPESPTWVSAEWKDNEPRIELRWNPVRGDTIGQTGDINYRVYRTIDLASQAELMADADLWDTQLDLDGVFADRSTIYYYSVVAEDAANPAVKGARSTYITLSNPDELVGPLFSLKGWVQDSDPAEDEERIYNPTTDGLYGIDIIPRGPMPDVAQWRVDWGSGAHEFVDGNTYSAVFEEGWDLTNGLSKQTITVTPLGASGEAVAAAQRLDVTVRYEHKASLHGQTYHDITNAMQDLSEYGLGPINYYYGQIVKDRTPAMQNPPSGPPVPFRNDTVTLTLATPADHHNGFVVMVHPAVVGSWDIAWVPGPQDRLWVSFGGVEQEFLGDPGAGLVYFAGAHGGTTALSVTLRGDFVGADVGEGWYINSVEIIPLYAGVSVDSFNDGSLEDGPTDAVESSTGYQSGFEEGIENDDSKPGKFAPINNGDADLDGIPDYDEASHPGTFVQLGYHVWGLPSHREAGVSFSYSLAAPGVPVIETGQGSIRLWAIDGYGQWTIVEPGQWFDSQENTLLEGVRPGAAEISMWLDPDWETNGPLPPVLVDRAKVSVVQADIDIDSDNTGPYDGPDGSLAEDAIEALPDLPGKFVPLNTNDDDSDGIPDFADGYDRDRDTVSAAGADDDFAANAGVLERFVPVRITLPAPIDLDLARLQILYRSSGFLMSERAGDPSAVLRSAPSSPEGEFLYDLPVGGLASKMRLWTKDGYEQRSMEPFYAGGSWVPTRYAPNDTGFYTSADVRRLAGVDPVTQQVNRTFTLYIEGLDYSTGTGAEEITIVVDPDGPGLAGFVALDTIRFTIGQGADLDIDSDNTSDALPEDHPEEDGIEDHADKPGKIIVVNDGDNDRDGLVDLADFNNAEEHLVPLVLRLPQGIDPAVARFSFSYSASDPAGAVQVAGSDGYRVGGSGHLRIWKKWDGDVRSVGGIGAGGHFVSADTSYTLAQLGYDPQVDPGSVTLYVEAVRASQALGDLRIELRLSADGQAAPIAVDAVRVTALQDQAANAFSGPVRLSDGSVTLEEHDFLSNGYDRPWGQSRTYTTQLGLALNALNGNNVIWGLPYLIQATSTILLVHGATVRYFDFNGDTTEPKYFGRFGDRGDLKKEGHEYVLTNSDGSKWRFFGFTDGVELLPLYQRGSFKQYTSPSGGTVATAEGHDADGRVQRVARGAESFIYRYYGDGENEGKLRSVTWNRTIDNAEKTVRRVTYTYYESSGSAKGDVGDLKKAVVTDGASIELDVSYYAYKVDSERVLTVVGPNAYERMRGQGITPESAEESQLNAYADNRFTFSSTTGRVETQAPALRSLVVYGYQENALAAAGFNTWRYSATEMQLDLTRTVYTNFAGQTLAERVQTGNDGSMVAATRYDGAGRVTHVATPSAVSTSPSTTDPDVVNLYPLQGLVHCYEYTTAGDVAGGNEWSIGLLKRYSVGYGADESGKTWQFSLTYEPGPLPNMWLEKTRTAYRGQNADPLVVTYTNQFSGTQLTRRVGTMPSVATSEHGSPITFAVAEKFDTSGRPTGTDHEENGAITYSLAIEYDDATGAMTRQTWATGSGAPIELRYEDLDLLGRPTTVVGPENGVTRMAYIDSAQDRTVYVMPPVGPLQMVTHQRRHNYLETRTGTGTTNHSMTRTHLDAAGRALYEDRYFSFGGMTYSPTGAPGTKDVNYYRTTRQYDGFGRLEQTTNGAGTITKTTFDDRFDLPQTVMVGTAPGNLIAVRDLTYDVNGNLSTLTLHPGGGAAHRVTTFYYDRRDRLVAEDNGVQLSYYLLDNLGQILRADVYDATQSSITPQQALDGQAPAGPQGLRARTTNDYDNRGRVYRSSLWDVNQATGAVGSNKLVTDLWYDNRDHVIKRKDPGGLVTKTKYDLIGRPLQVFLSDGLGDDHGGWTGADNVDGDNVLTQVDAEYDRNGNVIFAKTSQRLPATTATGPLTTASARVNSVARYYDGGSRLTHEVDLGTNATSRPASPPQRSDNALVTSYTYDAGGFLETVRDPRGVPTKLVNDALGRVVRRIEAYVQDNNAAPTVGYNRKTEFQYTPLDQVRQVKVYNVEPGTTTPKIQETNYNYGVSIAGGSEIDSNDLLGNITFPGYSGTSATENSEEYRYNALGQVTQKRERHGVKHNYEYDAIGRLVGDLATDLQPGMDADIQKLSYGHDTLGRTVRLSSEGPGATGWATKNEVRREYNAFGQILKESQAHTGSVDSNSLATSYGYAFQNNQSSLVSTTYPSGRAVSYGYDAGLDDRISRISYITDGGTTTSPRLEEYSYLGLDGVIGLNRPLPGGASIKLATTLDAFGRTGEQKWTRNSGATETAIDHFAYGYNRVGNRLFSENKILPNLSELYSGYTLFGEVTGFRRGTLTATKDGVINEVIHSRAAYNRDALGNIVDVAGASHTYDAHNALTNTGGPLDGSDAAGNTTSVGFNSFTNGIRATYDAWGRIVRSDIIGQQQFVTHKYDALGRVINTVEDATIASTNLHMVNQRDFFHAADGNVVEERTVTSGAVTALYVWGLTGSMVLRDRNADENTTTAAGLPTGMDERLYPLHDPRGSITALTDATGAVVERYLYDALGNVQAVSPAGAAYTYTIAVEGTNDRELGEYFVQPLKNFLSANSTALGGTQFAWSHYHLGQRYDRIPGLYDFGGGTALNPRIDRTMQTDPSAYAEGRNAYDSSLIDEAFIAYDSLSSIDKVHLGLDVVGIVDPTGIADVINAGIYAGRGDWRNASISFAGAALPYVGDALKGTRIVKPLIAFADKVSEATDVNRKLVSRAFSATASGTAAAAVGGASGFASGFIEGYIATGNLGGAWDSALFGARWGALQGLGGAAVRGFVRSYICFVAGTQVVVDVADAELQTDEFDNAAAAEIGAAEGTSVATASRRYVTVPIEQLVARGGGEMGDGGGQYVLSRDQHDPAGPLIRSRVTRTYERTAYILRALTLRDEQGRTQTLRVTEEHPFYVSRRGWTTAKELTAGSVLFGAERALVVVYNHVEEHSGGIPVYNLEVQQAHTYFVIAEGAGNNEAVWVHNAQYDIVPYKRRAPGEEKHHGILNEWAEHNIPGYKKGDAPALTLTPQQHDITRSVFGKWRYEHTGNITAPIDWTNVSSREMQVLSDRMFDAAGVPRDVQTRYYRAFHSYLYTGSF